MSNDLEFDRDFWSIYPKKIARAAALKMWNRLTAEEKFAAVHALPVHVRYWDICGRSKETTPNGATWLNPVDGRRWEDELEMPAKKSDADWWRSTAGIEAKARAVGMWPPRAGEDWMSLKARIMAKVAA
jgi:hypothetical protein